MWTITKPLTYTEHAVSLAVLAHLGHLEKMAIIPPTGYDLQISGEIGPVAPCSDSIF